jgi:hypothetical protein
MGERASRVTAWLKAHTAAEKSFARALRSYFQEQAERIADAWENFPSITPESASAIFHAATEAERLRPIIRRNAGQLMVQGAQAEYAALERRREAKDAFEELFDQQLPPRTRDAIRAALDDLEQQDYWQAIQSETETRLRDLIQEAIDQKWSNYRLGRAIREHLGGMAANKRAQKIARTETTGAMNAGHTAVMEDLADSGLVQGKEWNAIADQDTRQDHLSASGQMVQARGMFSVGGYSAPYPGYWGLPAAQRIHCRCTVLSVLDPSITPD